MNHLYPLAEADVLPPKKAPSATFVGHVLPVNLCYLYNLLCSAIQLLGYF